MTAFLLEQVVQAQATPAVAWAYGFIGWLVYNLYRMDQRSKEFDLDGDGYSYPEVLKYLKKSWVKIAISFLLVVVGIFEMPTIWEWILPNYKFDDASYFLAGFLSVVVQYFMDKYDKK